MVKIAWKNVHQHPIGTISFKVHSNILYYVGTRLFLKQIVHPKKINSIIHVIKTCLFILWNTKDGILNNA